MYSRGWRFAAASIVVTAFLSGACAPGHGLINSKGYEYKSRKYGVAFKAPSKRQFINDSWSVDNYVYVEDPYGSTWSAKKGRKYLGYRLVDKDGDGTEERERAFIYDLRLVHRKTNGVISSLQLV